ncbi:Transcription factor [Mycena sanguinolenta]|uniref:Transcription factor n=1 Tax=Mycena sanguinolenta TaxID=230812 RepID=A0A8H7CF79_9AGAR|nr:Transcription factor [Mycena sanguinolenta]
MSTPSSRAADRARITDIDAQVSSLKDSIQSLQDSIQALETEKMHAQERVEAYAYPVLTLPNEITSEIFTEFIPDYPSPPPLVGRLSPTTLTHICHKWRAIAVSTPALWRAISLPLDLHESGRLRILQSWLSRSGGLPLSFQKKSISWDLAHDHELETLVLHRARWEYVTLSVDETEVHTCQAPLPLLRQLDIWVRDSGSRKAPPTRFREVPRLRSLTFWHSYNATVDFLPWAQLTSLTLVNQSFSSCAAILQHTTNLVHCHLALCGVLNEPVLNVQLMSLESLILTVYVDVGSEAYNDNPAVAQYLKGWVTPALLTFDVPEGILPPDPVDALRVFISRSGCRLQRLCIAGNLSISQAVYLRAFPDVPKLSFNMLWHYNAYVENVAQGKGGARIKILKDDAGGGWASRTSTGLSAHQRLHSLPHARYPPAAPASNFNRSWAPVGDDDDFAPSRIRLPTLGPRGENFVTWKTQLKSQITGMGKARYINGRATEPVQPILADGADAAARDAHKKALAKYDEDLDEWEKNNEKIRTILFQSIHETHKVRIADHTSALESWNMLCKLYQHQGELHAQSLVDRMHLLKCPETERDPRPTLDQLDLLIADHASAGGILDDSTKKNIVLHLLPSSWRENVRTILANAESMRQLALQLNPTGVPPLYTADMLIEAIRSIARDDAAIHGTAAPSGGAALVAGPNDICDNCGQKGHWKRDCWSKGGGKEGQRPKNWQRPGNGNGKHRRGRGGKSKNNNGGNGGNNNNNGGGTANFSFAFHATADVATDFTKLEQAGIVSRGFTALIDSGANQHYCPNRDRFIELREIEPIPIRSADNRVFYARASGKVPITVLHRGQTIEMVLLDVLHAPEMPLTLISVSRMTNAGLAVHFEKDGARILRPDRSALFVVPERNGLYPVLEVHASKSPTPNPVAMSTTNSASVTLTLHEFHCRMGHADIRGLRNMISKGVVTGVKLTNDEAGFCKGCVMGILKREPFPHTRSSPTAKTYGGRVFSDTWGPAPKESLGRNLYFVVFVDDKSDEVVVTGMRKKNEAFEAYKQYEAWAKVQRGTTAIGEWGTDGGGEFTSNETETYLKNQGTHHRTLLAHARAMLHLASLPTFLWLEAVTHAAWLRNRTETAQTIGSTPHERATGNKPNLSQIRRFGANVWVKLEGASKIDMQAKPCRWMGIDAHAKGHRIYWPEQRKISVERNVRFEGEPEDVTYPSVPIEGELGDKSARDAPNTPAATPNTAPETHLILRPRTHHPHPKMPPTIPPPPELAPESEESTRSTRTRQKSRWLRDIESGEGSVGGRGATKVPSSIVPPSNPSAHTAFADGNWFNGAVAFMATRAAFAGRRASVVSACSGPERAQWETAMKGEVSKLEERGTWELVDRPRGANVLPSSFVLRRKRDENNTIKSYKARLVAGGHRQIYNVDYTETASPTMNLATFRFLLAIAAKYDLEAENIDFSSAYTNADLEETIYMEQPPGFKKPGHENLVCLLHKALYGLKQAGRQWYKTVVELLVKRLGFTRCAFDLAVFFYFDGDVGIVIGIHVDDSKILSNSKTACAAVKREIAAFYEITDLGPVRWLLGFEIRRDRAARRITMSQSAYAHPVSVPLDPHVNLYDVNASEEDVDFSLYSQLIGSLMYAAIGTRPDIAYAVSLLARFMSKPKRIHWDAAKRVLRYLTGSKNYAITFGLDDSGFVAYTDADHASQPDRHSISGNLFLFDGAPIAWSSRKQALIALSTTEAEYIAAASAAREITWLRNLVGELSDIPLAPTPLYCDNQGTIILARSGLVNPRNKHIDIRYRYVNEALENGLIALLYVPTNDQIADVLTKALPRVKLHHFRHLMGLRAT